MALCCPLLSHVPQAITLALSLKFRVVSLCFRNGNWWCWESWSGTWQQSRRTTSSSTLWGDCRCPRISWCSSASMCRHSSPSAPQVSDGRYRRRVVPGKVTFTKKKKKERNGLFFFCFFFFCVCACRKWCWSWRNCQVKPNDRGLHQHTFSRCKITSSAHFFLGVKALLSPQHAETALLRGVLWASHSPL